MKSKERYNELYRQCCAMKRSALSTLKLERGCVDCGYNQDPAALDFDHVTGDKSFRVGASVPRYGIVRLLAEVDKCEVRCANCHRVATADRRKKSTPTLSHEEGKGGSRLFPCCQKGLQASTVNTVQGS